MLAFNNGVSSLVAKASSLYLEDRRFESFLTHTMKKFQLFKRVTLVTLLVIFVFPFFFQIGHAAQTVISAPADNSNLAILQVRVDTLENLNERILNSVYWTLGILATIFLGLISVNLYFNITANKREIENIKKDFTDTAKNEILASEAKILEKVSSLNQKEFDNIKSDVLATAKNEILASEAKILEKVNIIDKGRIADAESFKRQISSLKSDYDDIDTRVKEFEIDRFAQKGQQGQIMVMIELLSKAVDKNNDYEIQERLTKIRDYVKDNRIRPYVAADLNKQLAKIDKNTDLKVLVDEIRANTKIFTDN